MELLAPAGSKDSLIAAVENGADTVYIGGKLFSARAFAANFSNKELEWAVGYCHIRGVKVYITVNILIHQHELEQAIEYIRFLYSIGVDAVIVQDIGLAHIIKNLFADFQIHASTQMTIHTSQGAKALARLGITRVVLARELGLDAICDITKLSSLEIEVFVHGALCISYSGQCLFSSLLGGRSGNRGQCAQPCRLPYQLVDATSGKHIGKQRGDYLLSPKDLNLIRHLPELKEAGVHCLKLEGRMKGPEYVAVITKVYRDGIDGDGIDEQALAGVFNRGFTTGFFLENQRDELIRWKPQPQKIDAELMQTAKQTYASPRAVKRISAHLFVQIEVGRPIRLTLIDQDFVSVETDSIYVVQEAINRCTTEDVVRRQLFRLGNTPLAIEQIHMQLGVNVMVPVSVINKARQRLVSLWESARIARFRREKPPTTELVLADLERKPNIIAETAKHPVEIGVTVSDLLGVEAAALAGADIIYYFGEIYSETKDWLYNLVEAYEIAHKHGSQLFLGLDRITKVDESSYLQGIIDAHQFDGLLVGDLGLWEHILSIRHLDLPVHSDWSLNLFNTASVNYLAEQGLTAAYLSPELTLQQIQAIQANIPCRLGSIVHGALELMISEYCPIQAGMGCNASCRSSNFGLRDRKGYLLPVKMDHKCRMHLYNPVDLCLIDQIQVVIDAGLNLVRIEGKARDEQWISQVINGYRRKLNGEMITQKDLLHLSKTGDFTRGHYYRGVK